MYFELPGMEQISFHINLSDDELKNYPIKNYPKYNGTWDGKENSTLSKLEDAINKQYINV